MGILLKHKNAAANTAAFFNVSYLFLALLVCNAAACLASGLAGCLALAAAAVLCAFAEITSIESLNSFHISFSIL